uniref:BEN domain-containing protein n=1 Tax=Trichogramma kaykai TaxID=54128 RepID=A0ABD2WA78_9HYME
MFVMDNYRKEVIEITNILEFKDTIPSHKTDFDSKKLYKTQWEDEKNPGGVIVPSLIGALACGQGEADKLNKKRISFPVITTSDLEKYSAESTVEEDVQQEISKLEKKKQKEILNKAKITVASGYLSKINNKRGTTSRKRLLYSDSDPVEKNCVDFYVDYPRRFRVENNFDDGKSHDDQQSDQDNFDNEQSDDSQQSDQGLGSDGNKIGNEGNLNGLANIENDNGQGNNQIIIDPHQNDGSRQDNIEILNQQREILEINIEHEENGNGFPIVEHENGQGNNENINDQAQNYGNRQDNYEIFHEERENLEINIENDGNRNGFAIVGRENGHGNNQNIIDPPQNINNDQFNRPVINQPQLNVMNGQQHNNEIINDQAQNGQNPQLMFVNPDGNPGVPGRNFVLYRLRAPGAQLIDDENLVHKINIPDGGLEVEPVLVRRLQFLERFEDKIYIGCGKAVSVDVWEHMMSKPLWIFVRNCCSLLWSKYELVNRCVNRKQTSVYLQNRSPRKKLEPWKHRCLKDLVEHYINGRASLIAKKQTILSKVNMHIGYKIKDLRNANYVVA